MRRIFSFLCASLMLSSVSMAQDLKNYHGEDRMSYPKLPIAKTFDTSSFEVSKSEVFMSNPLNQTASDNHFGFCDRSSKNLVGIGAPDSKSKVIGAITVLPYVPGNEIKGLRVGINRKTEAEARALVITYDEKNKTKQIDVKVSKKFQAKPGWNDVAFDAPYVCERGKIVIVGYQVVVDGQSDDSKPIALDGKADYALGRDLLLTEANFLEVGQGMKDFGGIDSKHGNLAILVDMNDKSKALENLAVMAKARITLDYDSDGRYPANKPFEFELFVVNLGRNAITSIDGAIFDGLPPNATKETFTLNVNIAGNSRSSIKLPVTTKTAKKGLGIVILEVKKYNGILVDNMAISMVQEAKFPYGVEIGNGAIARRGLLFERFTTEACVACPGAEPVIEAYLEQFELNPDLKDIELSVIAHHAGYKEDFLTLPESSSMLKYIYKGGRSFAPAVTINRTMGTDESLAQKLTRDFPDFLTSIIQSKQLARIDEVKVSLDRNTNKLRVEGRGWAGAVMNSALNVTVVITENKIPHRNQEGVQAYKKGPFVHKHVARQFLTPFNGAPVNFTSDDQFTFKLDEVVLNNKDWKEDDLNIVVFVHQDLLWGEMSQREVFASTTLNYKKATYTLDILPEDVPAVSVYNGYLTVTGAAQGVEVFDMSGRLVSTSIAKQLSRGVYVVKVSTAHGPFTHKVVVE